MTTMTREEIKDLLLKELCSRLPYNPMVEYKGENYDVLGITHGRLVLCKPFMSHTLDEYPLVEEVKPYLLSMSSMTVKQRDSYRFLASSAYASPKGLIDFFHKNHIDYRGLIEKGLAIEAPKGMYN